MKIWDFKFMNIKKIISIIFMSLIFCCFFLNQESYAKGSFRTIRHLPVCDDQMPVKLNDNEIFFPGNRHSGAKVLKVNEEEFIDLNVDMNISREGYQTLKLDKDNVLISGGVANTNDSKKRIEARTSIEIYNRNTNKFTLIKDAFIPQGSIVLNKDEIFTFYRDDTGSYFRIFNVKTKTFDETIGKRFSKRATKEEREASVTDKDFNSAIYHKDPINFLLDDGRVFIYEIEDYLNDKEITRDAVELYDPKTRTFEKIPLPKGIRLYITHAKLDNGKVLFIGSEGRVGADVIEFDPTTNKFQKYDEWNFPLQGSDIAAIDDNKIILLAGTIYTDDVFSRFDKSLENAVYDVTNKKLTKAKTVTGGRDRYANYTIRVSNKLLIFEYKQKIKVYEY